MSIRLISFAGVEIPHRMVTTGLPTVRNVQRATVAGGASYTLGIGRGEVRKYQAEGLFVGGKDLSNGYPFDLDRWIDRLKSASESIGVLRAQMGRDGNIRCCNAHLVNVEPVYDMESAAANIQRVRLEFESNEPVWYDEVPQVRVLTNATEAHCGNAGNAPTTLIEFEISNAIASTLTITNERNGYALTYGAMTDGTLVINCADTRVTVGGANQYLNTSRPATQTDALMKLEAGWNRITFDSPVTGVVRYHYAWH